MSRATALAASLLGCSEPAACSRNSCLALTAITLAVTALTDWHAEERGAR